MLTKSSLTGYNKKGNLKEQNLKEDKEKRL